LARLCVLEAFLWRWQALSQLSPSHNARTFDYSPGDVGVVPFAYGHYIENITNDTLRFLEVFRSPQFQDVSLNQWMALTPPELVKQHLEVNDNFMKALHKEKRLVVK
jgi:oxalate decarboxylase